jgi:hypothetical protein
LDRVLVRGFWQKRLSKVSGISSWFYAPASPEKLSEIVDCAYEDYLRETESGVDIARNPETVAGFLLKTPWNFRGATEAMARVSSGAYRRVRYICKRLGTDRTGTHILIGLREYTDVHGSWPGRLEDLGDLVSAETLVDPMNGEAFVYKLSDDGFVLYSKGPNGIDENGERGGDNDADDWMIWPQGRK